MSTHSSQDADSTGADSNANLQTGVILPVRLKVLHIISGDLWAGAEVQAFTLLTELKARCELQVATMNKGDLAERLQQSGINVKIFDEQFTNSLTITLGLIKLIREFQPDIVHTHRQKENILGSLANILAHWPWRKRAASLRTLHGAPEFQPKGIKKFQLAIDRWSGNHLQDAVISVSTDLSRKITRLYDANKVHTIKNGIDLKALNNCSPAADIREMAPEAIHIGIVGRLEPVKRVDIFIKMAALLSVSAPDQKLFFHIIGEGNLRQQLEVLARDLNLANLLFHGHRSDSRNAIAALDAVIMCSDHEGTPMSALETIGLGKALIAHSVGGLTEVLSEYPELLVREHTPEAYARCLMQQLQKPTLPQLSQDYSSEYNSTNTYKLYQALVALPRRSPDLW